MPAVIDLQTTTQYAKAYSGFVKVVKVMTAERASNNYANMFAERCGSRTCGRLHILGSLDKDTNGSIENEINVRINKASRSWVALSHAFMGRELSNRTRSKLFRSVIMPTLTYGAETSPAPRRVTKETRCVPKSMPLRI